MVDYQIEGDIVQASGAEIPTAWTGDVLVAGGGPAGLGAAIAAAKRGCKTMLVEKLGFVGGMCSFGCGMPLGGAYPSHRSIGGVAEEILSTVAHSGPESADVRDVPHFSLWFYHDSEFFKGLALDFLDEAGAEYLLHTWVVDVIMEDDTIRGVVTESKSGRQALLADAVVDATGDADIAAWAGAPFIKGRPNDGSMMAVSLPFIVFDVDMEEVIAYEENDTGFAKARERAIADGYQLHKDDRWLSWHVGLRPNTFFSNCIRILGIDGTDVRDLTHAEREARRRVRQHIRFLRDYVPGFEKAYVGKTSEHIGIRDTRRIIGEATLSNDAALECEKRPADTILRCGGPIDNVNRGKGSVPKTWLEDDEDHFDIPYGAIVPQGVDNLLVAGRCFSAEHLAQSGSRGMGLLMGMGQVAGTAASIIATERVAARDIDVKSLQGQLIEDGMDLGIEKPQA